MLQGWLRSLCVLHPPAWQEQKHQKKDQCQKARPQSCVQREVNVSIPVQQNQSVVQLETIEHFERYCGVLGLVDLFIYLFFIIDTVSSLGLISTFPWRRPRRDALTCPSKITVLSWAVRKRPLAGYGNDISDIQYDSTIVSVLLLLYSTFSKEQINIA